MRIVFVIGLYPYQIGGAEMQAKEIALALKSEGHEIHFVCYSSEEYSSEEFGVTILPIRKKLDIFYFETKKHLYKALDLIQPDLVYHRAFVPYSRFIATWCNKNGVPFYFHSADIYTLNKGNRSFKDIIHNRFLKYTLEHATGVICQNMEQYEALKHRKVKNVKIIYNVQRQNEDSINNNKKKNICWIAKFEKAKQPEIFVDFAEKHPDKDVTFTIFSSRGTDSAENLLLLKRINNNPRITLIQGKDNVFINKYLCETASLLVNTSVSEGISNTFIQAWMRGVPVVSLNSNPDNWFDSNLIGACCNGNIDKLHSVVSEILQEDNYTLYSNASINFANKHFSPQVVIPQLKKFMNI